MDLKNFFDHFLEGNELVRANLMSDESFDSIESLAEFKTESMTDKDILAEISAHLSMGEAALLRDLVDVERPDILLHIDSEVPNNGVLFDNHNILKGGAGPGFIHHDFAMPFNAPLKTTE